MAADSGKWGGAVEDLESARARPPNPVGWGGFIRSRCVAVGFDPRCCCCCLLLLLRRRHVRPSCWPPGNPTAMFFSTGQTKLSPFSTPRLLCRGRAGIIP